VKIKSFYILYITLLLSITVTGSAQYKILKGDFFKCASIQSVSGYETEFRKYIKEILPFGLKTETDNMGNLIVTIGEGEPEIMIFASIDEPGYVVSGITEDGYLRVQPVSYAPITLFHQFHEGNTVDIKTDRGMINGVVSIPSSHITRNKTEIISLEDFYIDIGARSKAEAVSAGINILDRVTAIKDCADLDGNRIAGPSISRKFPAFALIETLSSLKSRESCLFVWATQGLRRNSGAVRIAEKYKIGKIIIVTAFMPEYDRRTRTRVSPIDTPGSGVLIPGKNSEFANVLYNSIVFSARQKNIQLTESDIGALRETSIFGTAENQIVPIGIPVKFPYSLVETVDLDDLGQLVNLLQAVISR